MNVAMTIEGSDNGTSDSNSDVDDRATENTATSEQSDVTDDALASRRDVLMTGGMLSAGTILGVGTALGEGETTTAPDTFDGYKNAIDRTLREARSTISDGPYAPNWDSLDDVDPVPEWFRDAKFGIYFHVGPYSVPAYDSEWYPRNMYDVGGDVYNYHVENYGSPDEFPYQDFIPQYTAENFDAENVADLFQAAGARFGGVVTKHADGWSNYDSEINHWNAGDMGPEKDLVSELGSAIHDRDMRFVATFHSAYKFGYDYFEYAFENFPSVTEGYPERIMYGNVSEDLFHDQWLAEVVETLQEYETDLVYFDSGLETISETNRQRMLAYYYNQAAAQNRDVAVTHKQQDLPLDTSIVDYEEGGSVTIADQAWLADTPISTYSWGFVQDQEYKSVARILKLLVDSVSKNGQLMLNLSPRADGSIPEAQRDRILRVGDWLDTNGEAIYETRPWDVYGEGPHWGEGFTAEDVRYTQSKDGDTVYAIVLGWPGAGTYTFSGTHIENVDGPPADAGPPDHSNAPEGAGPPAHAGAAEVTLLGHGSVEYATDENSHLQVDIPDLSESERPSEHAFAFEIEGFDLQGVGADYTIDSSDIYAARVEEGLHEVSATVHNLARGEAPPATVRFENESTGTVIGEVEIDRLGLYGNTEVTVEWDTSDLPDSSEQKIRATVDPGYDVREQDETNNTAARTFELPAWPVDLVPGSIRVTGIQPGTSVDLTVGVRNRGTDTSAETLVRLLDVTGDTAETITDLSVPPIAPDSTAEVVHTWDMSGFETGTTRDVKAVVDPENTQPERDETNNSSSATPIRFLGSLPASYSSYASTQALFGTWNDNLVVNANGTDIWDETDEYGAIFEESVEMSAGDTAIVRVVDQEVTGSWAKAGLMVRNDVTAAGDSAGYAAVIVTGDSGFEFEWDSNGNGYVDSAANTGSSTRPCWLKLERSDGSFTASFSVDGQSWTTIGTADVPDTAGTQDAAVFVSSHTEEDRSFVEFDDFEVR